MAKELDRRLLQAVSEILRAFKMTEEDLSGSGQCEPLSPPEAETLYFVGDHPDCIASDVSRYLDVVPTTASSIIDRLVRRGLLSRVRPEDNRRVIRLRLTQNGLKVRGLIFDHQLANCTAMLKALKSDEQKIFVDLMTKIASKVSRTS
ncbi:MAG TPA: MarR family winged helix-turn-helix transcriptional regulator [Blastocatellia bacterium]